eukprot:gb/GECG01011667.1/.p1 GENE.gb/GECG01011667.1/~~gb/GECG01011667.1/.p1  ORF type:complete len:555 (+),score=115.99 gb/GECG01011667.1/:1-1665(+)
MNDHHQREGEVSSTSPDRQSYRSYNVDIHAQEGEEEKDHIEDDQEAVAQLNDRHARKSKHLNGEDNDDILSSSDDNDGDRTQGPLRREGTERRLGKLLSNIEQDKGDEEEKEHHETMDWNDPNQVQRLTERNAELMRKLKEKDKELSRLEEAIIAIEPLPGLEPDKFLEGQSADQDPRDSKIRDLAKKTRSMRLQVQRERDRASRLEAEVSRWKQHSRTNQVQEQEQMLETDKSGKEEEIKELRSQVKSMSQRLEKSAIKQDKLQNELKLTQKALQREIGEGVSMDQVLQSVKEDESHDRVYGQGSGHTGTWKGRAQKIVILKNRIKKLEDQLRQGTSEGDTENVETGKQESSVDDRAQQQLDQMREQRHNQIDELQAKLEQASSREAQLKEKLHRAHARQQVVESNYNQQKHRLQTLIHKTENDNRLIDALREKLQSLKTENEKSRSEDSNPLRVAYAGETRSGDDSKFVSSLKQEIANLRRENEELKSSNGVTDQDNMGRPGSSDKRRLAQLETQNSDATRKMKVIQVYCYQCLSCFNFDTRLIGVFAGANL